MSQPNYAERLPIPPTLWYENRDGDRYIPTEDDVKNLADPPQGYDFQCSQFPRVLTDTILKLVRDERGNVAGSEQVMTGTQSWPEDLVLAMTNSGKYKLSEAILVAAKSCERCMNALAHAYGIKWGYAADSDEYAKSRTECEICRPRQGEQSETAVVATA